MGLDRRAHVFRSPSFHGVVDEAIEFLVQTPVLSMPPADSFGGAGTYVIYYAGGFDLYSKIAAVNRIAYRLPIYVGKAVPSGWRAARSRDVETPVLYRRLREHSRSLAQANNLDLASFMCRFIILTGIETDLVVPVEAELIRRYRPLWNSVIEGFGNHDPGHGRYRQAKSQWDVLHPGRPWTERLTGEPPELVDVREMVRRHLAGLP